MPTFNRENPKSCPCFWVTSFRTEHPERDKEFESHSYPVANREMALPIAELICAADFRSSSTSSLVFCLFGWNIGCERENLILIRELYVLTPTD
jgi:hypothetical protein